MLQLARSKRHTHTTLALVLGDLTHGARSNQSVAFGLGEGARILGDLGAYQLLGTMVAVPLRQQGM